MRCAARPAARGRLGCCGEQELCLASHCLFGELIAAREELSRIHPKDGRVPQCSVEGRQSLVALMAEHRCARVGSEQEREVVLVETSASPETPNVGW